MYEIVLEEISELELEYLKENDMLLIEFKEDFDKGDYILVPSDYSIGMVGNILYGFNADNELKLRVKKEDIDTLIVVCREE